MLGIHESKKIQENEDKTYIFVMIDFKQNYCKFDNFMI